MITKNVKIIPISGSGGGSSRPGMTSLRKPGNSRLSSHTMIETIAQTVTPIGAKNRTPATK
jgi:hypothetical protein